MMTFRAAEVIVDWAYRFAGVWSGEVATARKRAFEQRK
jgi:hypothetical protein